MAVLEFIFAGVWRFLGVVILLTLVLQAIVEITRALRPSRRCCVRKEGV
jgi:hypothetical protein